MENKESVSTDSVTKKAFFSGMTGVIGVIVGLVLVCGICGFVALGFLSFLGKVGEDSMKTAEDNILEPVYEQEVEEQETEEPTETNNEEKPSETNSDTQPENNDSSRYINGLAPVDIYLSMEQEGFKTDKLLGGEYGNSWTSTRTDDGIDYRVETYSSNINNVESVTVTAMIDVTKKEIISAQQFFIFLSSLPYDNADPQKAGQWVKDNYNNDKSSTIIGDAKFTIYAPSVAVRMMRIEKGK